MNIKLFTLPFHPTTGFDDSALQAFLADKDLVCFWEHLFTHESGTHLACIVEWENREDDDALPRERRRDRERDRFDPTEGLSASDHALYESLRTWRGQRAHEEGIPAYRILTNRQLREIILRKPIDEAALATIPGIGAARAGTYGRQVLERLELGALTSPAGGT